MASRIFGILCDLKGREIYIRCTYCKQTYLGFLTFFSQTALILPSVRASFYHRLRSEEIKPQLTDAIFAFLCNFDLFRSDCFATSLYFSSSYRHFHCLFYLSWHGAARKAAPTLQHLNCHPLFPVVCDVVTCCETHVCTFKKDTRVATAAHHKGLRMRMQVHSELAERTVRLCSLWPESFAMLNKSWQSVPASHDFSFYLSSCLHSQCMPLRRHSIRRKRGWEERGTAVGASLREVVWNHCFHGNGKAAARGHYQFRGIDCRWLAIFNLNRLIGRHACRGIDIAAVFSELQLMSLSFGGQPGNSPLANDSPQPHL